MGLQHYLAQKKILWFFVLAKELNDVDAPRLFVRIGCNRFLFSSSIKSCGTTKQYLPLFFPLLFLVLLQFMLNPVFHNIYKCFTGCLPYAKKMVNKLTDFVIFRSTD